MPRSSAEVPEETGDYYDRDGYVFLDVPVSDAQPDWVELTPEQRDHVRPMSKVDERQWEAWHARENPSAKQRRGGGIGKRVDCGIVRMDPLEPALNIVAIDKVAGTITLGDDGDAS